MASKKNRSRKANRKSPNLKDRMLVRWRVALAWAGAHRWPATLIALVVLFIASVPIGYWVAQRLDPKRPEAARPGPRYARIEDIPGLPRYTETEPDQLRTTVEEKPRTGRPTQLAAATATAKTTTEQPAWRRNALQFRDLGSKPLVAIVIDDVGIDRPRSRRAWELPGPLTMSFLPYAKDLREQAKAARSKGHELMLHLPME